MRKKDQQDRRARIEAIEQAEAAARCVACKRPLAEAATICEDFLVPGKCCSDACLEAHLEAQIR